jgi:hypothetical protein
MLAGGMSFAHSGLDKKGERKLPMDASIRYERIVQSGLGIFPDFNTVRIDLRFYGRLFGK